MTMQTAKKFETLDLYLSSFLFFNGIELNLEIKGSKIAFVFEPTDKLYRLMAEFNSNSEVPVSDFVTTLKILRGKILSAKESIAGNGNGRRYGNGPS